MSSYYVLCKNFCYEFDQRNFFFYPSQNVPVVSLVEKLTTLDEQNAKLTQSSQEKTEALSLAERRIFDLTAQIQQLQAETNTNLTQAEQRIKDLVSEINGLKLANKAKDDKIFECANFYW